MAERKLEVKILGDSRDLERAFGRASGSAKRFDRSMSSVGRAGAALAKGFAVAAAGVTALAVVGAREMQEQAKVSAQTAVVLRNVGKASQLTTKQVEGLASALQAQTGAADDEIQSASNVILRFGLITKSGAAAEGQLKSLTGTALDLSVATGKDLNASAQALGRALASPEKAAGALRRAGIVLTAQQKDQIKTMVESGNVAGAQAKVLELVQSRVKGSADAFGKTLPGQVDRAKRAFEDLSENTLAALAPALSKLVPVLVKAISGIAPVIAQVGGVIAELADELISNPAFQEFAATLRDIAVQGVTALAGALRVVLPLVVAILAPIATLAGALMRSRVAMTALTAAFAAFVALRVTSYVTGLVSAFRALAITQTAATGMRALTSATSLLATGFSGVSAKAVGLAPGLTAAQAGLTRVGASANIAKGIFPQLGRAISGAFGGPVGIAIAAGTTLAVVIGGDLVDSFTKSKDPAQRYADAMNNAATATVAAKNSLAGLSAAMIGVGDAQDRTREATAARVIAERELRTLESQGITSGAQYEGALRKVNTTRRDEARAIGEQRTASETLRTSQAGTRAELDKMIQSLSTARGNAMAGAQALGGFGLSTGEAKTQYGQFLAVANGRIMGSQELKTFQTNAATMANEFRANGTPQAIAIANALDNVGKARTPAGVAKWAGELIALVGGSKKEVDTAKTAMNADFKKVGNVKPSTSFFTSLSASIGSVMGELSDLARKIAAVARQRASGGGKGSNERGLMETGGGSAGGGDDALSWFFGMRSQAVGALSTLAALASEKWLANDPIAQAILERRRQRAKDILDMQKRELQQRIAAAETADERMRLEYELQEIIDGEAWAGVEERQRSYEEDINNLELQFSRGEISAETFQERLNALLGGDPGGTLGKNFGERWKSAFEAVFGPVAALINQGFGGQLGAPAISGPSAGEAAAAPAAPTYTRAQWEKDLYDWSIYLQNTHPSWFVKGTNTMTSAGAQAYSDAVNTWIKNHPMPAAALGGITKGMTLAGEAGPEAIIPLTGTRGRSYMARVMEEVGRRGGGYGTIVVNVAGNEFSAEEFARKIGPELRRQLALTGSY